MIDKIAIEKKALELLKKHNLEGIIPVRIEILSKLLDYQIYHFTPDNKTRDIAGAVDRKNRAIYLNNSDIMPRQLFTAAHEIGHIVLHDDHDYIDYRKNMGTNSEITTQSEAEANYFAASLLMPRDEFVRKWNEYDKNINKISAYFVVSLSAAANRADSLGLS